MDGTRKGCYFLNFTASHDGIGVRPLEGLVPQEEFDYMIEAVYQRNGFVSFKKNKDGTESPYELNITYYDAFSDPDKSDDSMQIKRFLCSQAIMLAFKGVPGIYFHNLTATTNDTRGVLSSGDKRSINRMQWEYKDLEDELDDESTTTSYIMEKYKHMLSVRGEHPAFHPNAPQKIFDCGKKLFVLERTALDGSETILSVSNFTKKTLLVPQSDLPLPESPKAYPNVLAGSRRGGSGSIFLKPFETVWLQI
ncbi:MAG: hypothetical protein U5K69_19875 [Balneolaceae bacterium]|nr:hypothetical protein [Balneolaceae bacterium]